MGSWTTRTRTAATAPTRSPCAAWRSRCSPRVGRNSLRLRGRYLTTTAGVDPRDGVTLQIADTDGQIYCHDIPVVAKKRLLKRGVFRFRDRTGTVADGLRNARIKIRKDGRVVFRAAGRKMSFRTPTGNGLAVTLRVGNRARRRPPHCAPAKRSPARACCSRDPMI